jgi:MoaA/NifB/PqqE/SkfB family radical SAM enzyme
MPGRERAAMETASRPSSLTAVLERFMQRAQPRSAVVEATSHCQLRCPSCPTAQRDTDKALSRGYLTPSMLTRILDGGRKLRHLELSNWGEAFLNPKLLEILKIAKDRHVAMTISNGANLNNARDEVLEALVKYGVQDITCSIDGASQATYEKYRRGGNFDQVISNIKRINHFKEKYRSTFPLLRWQFILFGHNEHEVDKARQMAADLNMAINFKLSWDPDYAPVADQRLARRLAGAADRQESSDDHGIRYHSKACTQLWRKPAINWDGKVIGCAVNYWGNFGDIDADGGFTAAVNSDRMKYARKMLMGLAPPRGDVPCSTCEHYLHRQRSGHWITPAAILVWAPLREFLYRHGLTRAVRQLVVFRLPALMRVPIVRRALLGGV